MLVVIIGIGSDVIAVDRIKKLLASHESAFLKKILTANELKLIGSISEARLAGYMANRFAAKEAFSKALGTGIGEHVSFQDIEVFKNPQGKPYFELNSKLKLFLESNYGDSVRVHLSMSNETEYAQAFVVIEK